ncbi:MAG: hypothetical protein GY854_33860 [Deltaproteobacteria bacterium]|nr:hypothetical protein [Deltaproteobacteria bacterium]
MKWICMFLCAGVFVFVFASVKAHAQSPSDEQDRTEYKFDDDVVEGTLLRPDGMIEVIDIKGRSRSLIKLRGHFVHEMLKTVEDF